MIRAGLKWETVTVKELESLCYKEQLSDREIAEMYGVAAAKVTYKRTKYGISREKKIREQLVAEFVNQNGELYESINAQSKSRLLKNEHVSFIAKAVTHFAFRNGPVEDMHADGKLSQTDMKTLNQYMANRLAGLLYTIFNNEWLKLELLLSYYKGCGANWDAIEPENAEIEYTFNQFCRDVGKAATSKVFSTLSQDAV